MSDVPYFDPGSPHFALLSPLENRLIGIDVSVAESVYLELEEEDRYIYLQELFTRLLETNPFLENKLFAMARGLDPDVVVDVLSPTLLSLEMLRGQISKVCSVHALPVVSRESYEMLIPFLKSDTVNSRNENAYFCFLRDYLQKANPYLGSAIETQLPYIPEEHQIRATIMALFSLEVLRIEMGRQRGMKN